MSNVFSRSWEITKISFRVIGKDKELLIYPILSSIFSLLFSAAMLFPKIIYQIILNGVPDDYFNTLTWVEYLIVFATYLGLALIATFFNVCVVFTVKTRFEGGNATLGSSFRFAFSKFHLIIAWSLLTATVGLLLYILDQFAQSLGNAGKIIVGIIRSIIAMAWNIVTIFVVPAMVYYGLKPKDAIKKSIDTLSKTWGESIVRHYGLGLIQFLLIVLGMVISIVIGILTYPIMGIVGIFIAVGVLIIYILIVLLIFTVATSVYNTALFVYADTGRIPQGYNKELMSNAFRQKKVRTR
ncbi:MAG: DUF6159 family protein [Promethearchaeota archaeon]